ncbi:MAG: cupin domain-containing protein [Candidatus Handelsmanbacteria bacterium]|nr:cupin domain-containing protein [Candidatus Handelsmanbacteria bacterium]
MILRHWMDCPIYTYGRLREWRIFTRRQGDTPNAETGEVCFEINTYGRAAVIPGVTTEPATYPNEVYCVGTAGGQGLLHLGSKKIPLRAGTTFFMPPSQRHRFENTGEVELEFIFCRKDPGPSDLKHFDCHHWSEDRPRDQWGQSMQGHWNHVPRGPGAGLLIADIPPRKFSHPHNHPPTIDEIWYVNKGSGWHWMRQEYHVHSPGYALWLEPSELHSLMNPHDENLEFIYCASANEWSRHEAARKPEKLPAAPGALSAALEEKFGAIAAAYRHTGLSIFGVDRHLEEVEQIIKALNK